MKRTAVFLAAACTALTASAWTIRPGLIQAKSGSWTNWDEQSAGVSHFDASSIPVERVPGPVMADVKTDENGAASTGYTNPWTGSTYYWNTKNTMWRYKGQIYLEAGTTYAFGKYLDDAAMVKVAGKTLIENTSWDQFVPATYSVEASGWYDFDVGVYDGTGGKGPYGGAWGNYRGLGWNATGATAADDASWTTIRDPGDMSVLRVVDEAASLVRVVRVDRTATGYDVAVRLDDGATGTVVVALSATDSAVATGSDLASFADKASGAVSAAGTRATVSVPWSGADVPYIVAYATGTDEAGCAFATCSDPVAADTASFAGRAISVTPVEENGAIVSFSVTVSGGHSASTNTLVMAYGTSDHGDRLADWGDAWKAVDDVEPGTQTFSVPAPDGWGDTVLAVRFFVTAERLLPYAREVECLTSHGASWFDDLGYRLCSTSKVVLRFIYALQSGGIFFGTNGGANYFRFFAIPQTILLDINGENDGRRLWPGRAIDTSTVYLMEIGDHYMYVANDNSLYQGTKFDYQLDRGPQLMCADDYGTIYSINIRENDTDGDTAQYIPVVGWDGRTALYEKISGTMYYASADEGCEDFTPGATVATSDYGDIDAASPATVLAVLWVEDPPAVTKDANGNFVFTASVASGTGSLRAVYGDGTEQLLSASATGPATVSQQVTTALAADATYTYAVRATDGTTTRLVSGEDAFYNGTLAVAKTSDASESDLSTPGVFTISRADSAADLVVSYTLGGTAVAGTNYRDNLSGTVTIPAGSTSATVEVEPLLDTATRTDTTVTLTLAEGLYAGVGASATLTIAEVVTPAGYNTWVASESGSATDGANWSEGRAPVAEDKVLFDGIFSSANCTWDVATLPQVAVITQSVAYAGTVAFDIAYPTGTETPSGDGALVVTGDAALLGGKWTQVACGGYADTKRLAMKVGGDLTIASGALIDVTLKGSMSGHGRAGCYGGDNGVFGQTYGDPKHPFWCGSGNGADNSLAGGAVWIEVTGGTTLDGNIVANGTNGSSGGSVYLKTASLSGGGHIYANGNNYGGKGSGGRIAVELTGAALPAAFTVPGSFQAYGCAGSANSPGAGTVVLKSPGQTNGDLYVNNGNRNFNRWNGPSAGSTQNELTTIPAGGEWTFDHVYIGGYATLAVPENTVLNLPNGFVSVGLGGMAGVRGMYALMGCGGTINAPAINGAHTFADGAFFYPAAHYAFAPGDVVVRGGAAIGASYLRRGLVEKVCDFAVTGDLTIEDDGYVDVTLGGFGGNEGSGANYTYTANGCHGGQNATHTVNNAYGSVFSPVLSGSTNGSYDNLQIGAGVARISVSGELAVYGTITASGRQSPIFGAAGGNSGGSISIVAGSLAGTGTIAADGGEGFTADDNLRWNVGKGYARGGGGRIAIRLTDGDFAAFGTANILARGRYSNHNIAGDFDKTPLASSAGTVYLQAAGEAEKGGTVIVRNRGTAESSDWTHSLTWLPAGTLGDAASDFRQSKLVLDGAAWMALGASLRAKSIDVASGSALDLYGATLVVDRAKIGGVRLSPGTYAAGSTVVIGEGTLADYLVDTADGAGGSLVVSGGGFALIVR